MKIKTKRMAAFAISCIFVLSSVTVAVIQTARINSIKTAYEDEIFGFVQNCEISESENTPTPSMQFSESESDTSEENLSTLYTLPVCETYEGMKCYEDYKCIKNKTSRQYELQQIAYTDYDGFRKIADRYLVAIGTYFEAECGTLFDIILENGEKIPAIVGDIKADIHTDAWNVYSAGKCATEFMIDDSVMSKKLLDTGDVSYYCSEWRSKVKALYVYDENILDPEDT